MYSYTAKTSSKIYANWMVLCLFINRFSKDINCFSEFNNLLSRIINYRHTIHPLHKEFIVRITFFNKQKSGFRTKIAL
jgi:hypothetical protein